MASRPVRLVAALLGLLYATAAVALVLWPDGDRVRRLQLDVWLFGRDRLGVPATIGPDHYTILGNVLLLVPLAVAAVVVLGPRWWWLVAIVGVLTGFAAEYAQARLGLNRVPEVEDAVLNGLGAAVAALVSAVTMRMTRAPHEDS